jgi:murein tripeptide amidase MpaA
MQMKFSHLLIFGLLSCVWLTQVIAADSSHPASGYHDYAALTAALKKIAQQNPGIAQFSSIGKTMGGRDLWLLQLSGSKGRSATERPALLICGNVEGDHVIGSEVALGIAEYLVAGYGKDKEITEIMDRRTFYIIPRLNPDGAELFFQKTLEEHSGNLRPFDDDFDWKIDEDPAEDLNHDGWITLMRKADKNGGWKIDPQNPRLMVRKEQDTPLDSLYQVWAEGIDNDGDERYNEDGVGGININRNFPHNFGYDVKGIGLYPASEVETRALIDFINRYDPEQQTQPHGNICAMLLFSKYDNLAAEAGIECGKAEFPALAAEDEEARQTMMFQFRRRGEPQPPASAPPKDPQPQKTDEHDLPLFKKVSERYKKITGIESAVSDKPVGSLLEWAYFQYGVPSFSANLWSLRQEKAAADSTVSKSNAPTPPESARDRRSVMRMAAGDRSRGGFGEIKKEANRDAQWLKWIERENQKRGFLDWQKFNHSQLGEVEIGGFQPYLRINPASDQIPSLSESHAKFAIYLASQLAEIQITESQVEKVATNLFRLKVKVQNNGQFPYATAMGQQTRNINPIMLQLKFDDDQNMKLFGGTKRETLRSLDARGEKEFKWMIISPPNKKVVITLWARHGGGRTQQTVVLK